MSVKPKEKPSKRQLVKRMKRTNLDSALQEIYYGKVNLDSTQTCECFCCKVAMPSMQFCEFTSIISHVWTKFGKEDKINLICTSIEYFLKNELEKFGIQTLVKPCMLLDRKTNLCRIYTKRPLSCRLFGLWPQDAYNARVERFAKAYAPWGLSAGDLPLNSQCALVKRNDDSVPLTNNLIGDLYASLDKIDKTIGNFSDLRISQKENYRSFHDWLLLKVFGEPWLEAMTNFLMAATREQIEDLIRALRVEVAKNFESISGRMHDE